MKKCTITDKKMEDIYKKIGQNVKKHRNAKKISQLELSLAMGHKAVGTVSMAELYLNKKHFNLKHLYIIADILEIDVCELLK